MKSRKRTAAAFLLGMVLGTGGMWLTVNLCGGAIISPSESSNLKYVFKAGKIMDLISEDYYIDVDEDSMAEGMYKGIAASLDDPYSQYMTADEYMAWRENITGKYCGIGVTIRDEEGEYTVVNVYHDSPAYEAGLKEGDVIKQVDGREYETVSELSDAIKGEAGTNVTITYERGGSSHKETLTREEIEIENVSGSIIDDTCGYVSVTSFNENTCDSFLKEIDSLKSKGVDRVVIDLRDNGGGLLDEGIRLADALLDSGDILTYVYRNGEKEKVSADNDSIGIPFVVLVNGNTASASEIVTAAVKDSGKGKIVGVRTFGKGVIQSTRKLSDGSALKLTVMEYRSPDGNVINGEGIEPDYKVKDYDRQLTKAVSLLQSMD